MNTYKKLKLKSNALMVALLVVGLGGLVAGVSAYSNYSQEAPRTVIEKVENYNEAAPITPVVPQDNLVIGSATSPYLPGPDFAVGLDNQFSVSAEMADATNTWAFATPFLTVTSSPSDIVLQYDQADKFGWTGATTTVEMMRLTMTSSTPTAYQIGCGGGATPYATSTASVAILNSDNVPALVKSVIENNITSSQGAAIGGGSTAKIMIGPTTPYIVCRVYSAALTEWTGTDSVKPGRATVRFSRTR